MYVDGTTASEIISKGDQRNAQFIDTAADWSRTNRWFSRYVIAAMLVDEDNRPLISPFCSSTSICTFYHCHLCL